MRTKTRVGVAEAFSVLSGFRTPVGAGNIRSEADGSIARLVLDRPPVNALSFAMVGELAAAVSRADKTPGVRVALLSGAGGTFCGGTDLRDFEGADPKPA